MKMSVPASARLFSRELFRQRKRRIEGPFGDHFGHYSEAAEFPVFHIASSDRRRNAVYAATVVGKPPQEDKFLGLAAGRWSVRLIKLIHPNVGRSRGLCGAGFHNLLVASGERTHPRGSS
jgi:4-hydroxy-3-polyprenylbenzoate decarboxylase